MSITPTHLSVGALFTHNFIFRVPKFQRYYAWGDEQIEDFLKDLAGCYGERAAGRTPRHHFLGGIVTVSAPVAGTVRQQVEIVDGQQRLATFTILAVQLRRAMSALRDTLADPATQAATFLDEKVGSLRQQYEWFKDSVGIEIVDVARLELSKPDHDFFAQLLAGEVPAPTRQSHHMIVNAFNKIGAHLAALVASGTDEEKAQRLARVAEVLADDWTIIHMAATTSREAHMLFQVLNDRGTGLTEGELLRSTTLEVLDRGGTDAQSATVEGAWDTILGREPVQIETGLRWIYSSYEAARPGKRTLFDEFLASRFPMHMTAVLATADAAAVVTNVLTLRDDFSRMDAILDGSWPYATPAPQLTQWDRDRLRLLIVELKHTISMPLLIAASALDQMTFFRIVHALERFVFRYKVVVNARIEPALKIYLTHAKSIRDNPTAFQYSALEADLRVLLATGAPDAIFQSRLSEMRYTKTATNKPIKYMLLTLDSYHAWYIAGAGGTPTPTKTSVADFTHNTLEHIYAQNPEDADPALDARVNEIGNLAVLSPADNAAAGNKPVAEKLPILQNSLSPLNRSVVQAPAWDVAAVDAREALLKNMAVHVFAL